MSIPGVTKDTGFLSIFDDEIQTNVEINACDNGCDCYDCDYNCQECDNN